MLTRLETIISYHSRSKGYERWRKLLSVEDARRLVRLGADGCRRRLSATIESNYRYIQEIISLLCCASDNETVVCVHARSEPAVCIASVRVSEWASDVTGLAGRRRRLLFYLPGRCCGHTHSTTITVRIIIIISISTQAMSRWPDATKMMKCV